MNFIKRWLHHRRLRKHWAKSPEKWREDVMKLHPGDMPFLELMKRLNTPGTIVPNPEFKYFGRDEEQVQLSDWRWNSPKITRIKLKKTTVMINVK